MDMLNLSNMDNNMDSNTVNNMVNNMDKLLMLNNLNMELPCSNLIELHLKKNNLWREDSTITIINILGKF